jgi:hypothetical protein
MKSHTSDSTVTTNQNGHNSTVSVTTSNKISLEDTIKDHSPKNLKGKTIGKITIKETKKEFKDVCAECILYPYLIYSKESTIDCCSSSKKCGNRHVDVRFDGFLGICGEHLKTGKCKNKYCKRAHVLEVDSIDYTRISTNKSTHISTNSSTRISTNSSANSSIRISTTIFICFDITSATDFPKLPIKQNTKKRYSNNVSSNNVWNEPQQILKIIKMCNMLPVTKEKHVINKENHVINKENHVINKENHVINKEKPAINEEKPATIKVKILITNEQPLIVKVKLSINEIQSAINTNLKLSINNMHPSIIIDDDGYILVQRHRKTPSPVSVISPIPLSSPAPVISPVSVTSFSPIELPSKSTSSPLMFEPNMLQKLRNDFNKSPIFVKVKPNISKKVLKKENAQKNKEEVLKSKENILNKNSKDDSDSDSDYESDSNSDYDSDEDYNSKFWSKKK